MVGVTVVGSLWSVAGRWAVVLYYAHQNHTKDPSWINGPLFVERRANFSFFIYPSDDL